MNSVTEKEYTQAKEIVRLYELYERKAQLNKMLPICGAGEVIEYRDLTGKWYYYDESLRVNPHFIPEAIRVVKY